MEDVETFSEVMDEMSDTVPRSKYQKIKSYLERMRKRKNTIPESDESEDGDDVSDDNDEADEGGGDQGDDSDDDSL